jgi:hypothetical protein
MAGVARRRFQERSLLAWIGLLVAGSLAVLALEAAAKPGQERTSREFQGLVHGLGMGPAVDLSGCAFAFDPRLADRCSRDTGPLPMGSAFCPYHSLSVFSYPSPDGAQPNADPD